MKHFAIILAAFATNAFADSFSDVIVIEKANEIEQRVYNLELDAIVARHSDGLSYTPISEEAMAEYRWKKDAAENAKIRERAEAEVNAMFHSAEVRRSAAYLNHK